MTDSRRTFAALMFLAVSASLFARGGAEPSPTGSAVPVRIVQAGSSAFMVENALYLFPEARTRVVALADGNQGGGLFVADIDTDFSSKTILPRNANTEAILALDPDTVVMKNFMKSRMGESLERVGIATVYLDLESPEAWLRDIETLGVLFGNPQRAAELSKLVVDSIRRVTDRLFEVPDADRPRVLFLYRAIRDGVNTVNVPPPAWMQTRMVELAAGSPVWTGSIPGDTWMSVGLEQIAAWDPDIIIVAAYHMSSTDAVAELLHDPSWSSLRAVRNGHIHAMPADYHSWDQPDIRWLLGLRWMASVFHPDRFKDLDMESEARGFFSGMFGIDDASFNELIEPKLTGID